MHLIVLCQKPNKRFKTDITYIQLPTGNVYLMAIIDWFSRKVLSWRIFNTMDALQYANLLKEAIEAYGCPAIFNTGQESSLRRIVLSTCWKRTTSKSAWTEKKEHWTIFVSSVCGGASSTRIST